MRTIARQRARAAAWRVGFALGLAALLSAATVAWGGVGVTVTVGGTSVSVAQPACPASPQVSPTSVSFSAAGDPRIELTVHEEAACVLNYIGSLTADQEWIAAYATHQGSPTEPLITQLWIEVTDNTGPARSGTVMVGGTSVSVAQASGQAPECPGSPERVAGVTGVPDYQRRLKHGDGAGRRGLQLWRERRPGLDHGDAVPGGGQRAGDD